MKSKNIAVEYNGNQLTPNYLINTNDPYYLGIDYLVLNLEKTTDFERLKSKHHVKIEPQNYGTKNFKNRDLIYYKNELIAEIVYNPRSEIINQKLTQLQFKNHIFYTKITQLWAFLKIIETECNLKTIGLSRLDICIDFNIQQSKVNELVNNILNQKNLLSGREKILTPHFITHQGKINVQGFSLGKRTSSRFMRFYNKTLEINNKPKQYIFDTWKQNNIDVNNVFRLEYQLNSKFFKELELLNTIQNYSIQNIFDYINDNSILLQLFQIAINNHFEITENTNKSQINKEKKINLIDFTYLKSTIKNLQILVQKTTRLINTSYLTIKRNIKALFKEYYNNKQNEITYLLALKSLFQYYQNEHFNAWEFFNKKFDYYLKEFELLQKDSFSFSKTDFNNHLNLFI